MEWIDGLNEIWVGLKNRKWVKFKDWKCLKWYRQIIKRRKNGLKGEKGVKFTISLKKDGKTRELRMDWVK